MANIHQTLKRVAALYEGLIGTREEITRCVEELQRWQREERERRRQRHLFEWTLVGAITIGMLVGFITGALLWSRVGPS